MPAGLRQRIHDICRDYMLGRLEEVFEAIDDEIEFSVYAPPDVLPAAVARQKSKAAFAALLLEVQAEYEHLSYRPHVIGGDATTAAVAILARLRRRSTGEVFDVFIVHYVRFRDGRMVEMREFVDHGQGIEQLLAHKPAAPHSSAA